MKLHCIIDRLIDIYSKIRFQRPQYKHFYPKYGLLYCIDSYVIHNSDSSVDNPHKPIKLKHCNVSMKSLTIRNPFKSKYTKCSLYEILEELSF
jgi:hypothetical protein